MCPSHSCGSCLPGAHKHCQGPFVPQPRAKEPPWRKQRPSRSPRSLATSSLTVLVTHACLPGAHKHCQGPFVPQPRAKEPPWRKQRPSRSPRSLATSSLRPAPPFAGPLRAARRPECPDPPLPDPSSPAPRARAGRQREKPRNHRAELVEVDRLECSR